MRSRRFKPWNAPNRSALCAQFHPFYTLRMQQSNAGVPDRHPDMDSNEKDSFNEQRIRLLERVHRGPEDPSPPGVGWRVDQLGLAEPGYCVWERVIKDGPEYQLVEQVFGSTDEPNPPGDGWQKRTEPGAWQERVLRDPGRDLETDYFEEDDWEPETTSGRGPLGSSAAHPRTGASLRAFVTMSLISAIIVTVLLGILLRLPTEAFAAYIAPLSALAGTALGYWFGSESRT
jgi:hypothetical protein